MTVKLWVNNRELTQRLICVVVDDLVLMRFKTEHLPTEGKVSEGKTTNTHFAFPSKPDGATATCWHKTLGENRRNRRPLWKCRSGSEVKNLKNLTDYDGLDFCIHLNEIQSPWRRTQRIPPKHRYRVPILNGVKNRKTIIWASAVKIWEMREWILLAQGQGPAMGSCRHGNWSVKKDGNSMTSWTTSSLSRRTLFLNVG